ncbi:MAG: hypothetical protein R2912_08910 [Eubacteriales bacterium]
MATDDLERVFSLADESREKRESVSIAYGNIVDLLEAAVKRNFSIAYLFQRPDLLPQRL